MGKFFYKNNNYKKGGKVRYNNGGTTDPDPNPIATRNVNTDFFDPNFSAQAEPFRADSGFSGKMNFNPRISVGPDGKIGNNPIGQRSQGRFTMGPSLSTSLGHYETDTNPYGGSSLDVEKRTTLGAKVTGQIPIGNKGIMFGGSGEFGGAWGDNYTDSWSGDTYLGPQTSTLKDRRITGYNQGQVSLGYYPKQSGTGFGSSRGGKLFAGYGSEGSTSPGLTVGGQYNMGPINFNVQKNRRGLGAGLGFSLPLGGPTKRIKGTGDVNQDYVYNNGGITKNKYNNGGPIDINQLNETYRRNNPTTTETFYEGEGDPGSNWSQEEIDQNAAMSSAVSLSNVAPTNEQAAIDAGIIDDPKLKNNKFQEGVAKTQKVAATAGTALELGKTAFGEGDPEGEISGGKMALSGAMKGASAGAAYGPWGALIGAGVGAVAGSTGAAKNRQARTLQGSEESTLANLGDVRDHLSSNISQQKSEQYIQELISEQLKNPEQKQNVVSGLQSDPKSSLLGKYGMKLQKSFNTGGIMGDKNPHVSDDNYNSYYSQLQMGENAGSKGYDAATGLWYPFSVGINDERNIGWGINMSTFSKEEQERLSKGITQKEVEKLYSDRIAHHLDKSQKYINSWDGSWSRTDKNSGETLSGNTGYKGSEGNWAKLPDNVKLALTDFSYNLGGLQKFPKFVTAVMNNDLNGAMAEYKRYYTDNGVRKESTKRNEEIHNMLFKNAKGNGKIYKKGGMTPGENNHDSNPLTVIDSNGQNTGMELTGGEGVYDAASQKKIESFIKKKKYAEAGKIIEYEINDWKRRGMYS